MRQYIVSVKVFVMADNEQDAVDAVVDDLKWLTDLDSPIFEYPFYEVGKANLSVSKNTLSKKIFKST